MELAWGALIFFSALTVFVSGDSEKCYDVKAVHKGGCVDTIKVVDEGDVWFSGLCAPPFHLYKLDEGNVTLAASLRGRILQIERDSDGRPYMTVLDENNPKGGWAYTIENNGTPVKMTDDDTVGYVRVDKDDNVYITSSKSVQRYKWKVGAEEVKGIEPDAHFFYEDSHGNDFFIGEGGRVWELKVDGSTREIVAGSIRKIVQNPNGPGYLIASDTGIHLLNGDSVIPIYNGSVYDAVLSKDGYFYFSTRETPYILKSGKITPIEGFQHRDTTRSLDKLFVDGHNNIYFLTEYVHVLRPNETTPQLVTGLPSEIAFRRVAFDSHDNALFSVFDESMNLYFLPANSLEASLVDEIKATVSCSGHHEDFFYIGTAEGLYSLTSRACK